MSISSIAMSNVNYSPYNYTSNAKSSDNAGDTIDKPQEKIKQATQIKDENNINYDDIKGSLMSDSQGQRMNMNGTQGTEGDAPPPPPPPPPPSQSTEGTSSSDSDLISSLTSTLDSTNSTETTTLIDSMTDNTVSQEDLEKYDTNNDGKLSQAEEAKMNSTKEAEKIKEAKTNGYQDQDTEKTVDPYVSNAINTYSSMSDLSNSTVTSTMTSILA